MRKGELLRDAGRTFKGSLNKRKIYGPRIDTRQFRRRLDKYWTRARTRRYYSRRLVGIDAVWGDDISSTAEIYLQGFEAVREVYGGATEARANSHRRRRPLNLC